MSQACIQMEGNWQRPVLSRQGALSLRPTWLTNGSTFCYSCPDVSDLSNKRKLLQVRDLFPIFTPGAIASVKCFECYLFLEADSSIWTGVKNSFLSVENRLFARYLQGHVAAEWRGRGWHCTKSHCLVGPCWVT